LPLFLDYKGQYINASKVQSNFAFDRLDNEFNEAVAKVISFNQYFKYMIIPRSIKTEQKIHKTGSKSIFSFFTHQYQDKEQFFHKKEY
jgi:hypothetical protein